MSPYEIIAKKRDGQKLSDEEIQWIVSGFLSGEVADYQLSAWLMAVFFQGMDHQETAALTRTYIESGRTIDLSGLEGIKVDKHSTGGVGDKVSIILAPLVASFGVKVPMISGRGLGHTGGTLDKLESIPGFQVFGTIDQFKKQLREIGVAMLGQTADVVPADKKIYALRDVTATVESLPLISASIMSKKIAEGMDSLVLDVKYGSGAFMPDPEKAEKLARKLIRVGESFGKKVTAFLTSMEQPLGLKIGNWLEVEECLDCLHGGGPADLKEVVLALSGEMLVLGGAAATAEEGKELSAAALSNGSAFHKFEEMVKWQGGETKWIRQPQQYPAARFSMDLAAEKTGYVEAFSTREVGLAAVQLGAGRARSEDKVDPAAGIVLHKKCGDEVRQGEPVLTVYSNREKGIKPALLKLKKAIRISEDSPGKQTLILKKIQAE
ncbi:MAG: thymidine phosphorylase [Calditrichia bacterium]